MGNNMIFVFGSNLAGRHGKGAALHAKNEYEAQTGVGHGPTGRAYAIPTKDHQLKVLSLEIIDQHINDFFGYTQEHPELMFLLTPIGTGLAGYSKHEIVKLLRQYRWSDNVVLTMSWID